MCSRPGEQRIRGKNGMLSMLWDIREPTLPAPSTGRYLIVVCRYSRRRAEEKTLGPLLCHPADVRRVSLAPSQST